MITEVLKYSRHQNYRFFYCRFPKKIFNLGLVVSPTRTCFHDAPCIFKEICTGFNTFFYSYPFLSCSLSLLTPLLPPFPPLMLSLPIFITLEIFSTLTFQICVFDLFFVLSLIHLGVIETASGGR